jgi:hyperosmotically inducible periplasmic protein
MGVRCTMTPMKITPIKTTREPHTTKRAGISSSLLPLAITAILLGQSPLKATETDDRIEATAKSSYVFRTFLKEDSIKAASKDGVVTLTGSVKDNTHKQLAEDTVAGLPEVKSVVNQIETKENPPENSDTWLYLKVKSTLAYHRSVSAFNTQVEMKEGTAILKGEASSQAQKDLVTEYTKDVIGIKGVQNEMTITTPGKSTEPTAAEMIDDASITAQVRMALISHRSTSILSTMVSTSDGIVTVGGKANNAAEVDLVTKLVTDINGVKSVVNSMSIAASSN